MPTHHAHDQTSEANQRRTHKYSLKDRDPAKYQELDRMLVQSSRGQRVRKLLLWIVVAAILSGAGYALSTRAADQAWEQAMISDLMAFQKKNRIESS